MSAVLISLLIILYSANSMCCKLFSQNYTGDSRVVSPVFSVYYCLLIAAATFAVSGFTLAISKVTVIFGVFNALALVGYNISKISAMESGPYSVVIIASLFGNIFIPLLNSMVTFGEAPSVLQWIGIAIVLVAFIFLNREKNGTRLSDTVKPGFFLWCGLLFLSNGIYGAILDSQQRVVHGTENNGLTVVTYTTAGIISLIILFVSRRGKAPSDLRLNRKSVIFVLICTACLTCALMVMMYSLSVINVGALFTAESGGVLLVSVLISAVVFKEKLIPAKLVGIALTFVGIVLLSIPQ